jgi:serine/threonine protein kinase/tetratricopeptide (TPR) repeat protein
MAELDAEARSIFLSLIDRPQDEWPAALADACADQPDVRARVERLLADHLSLGTISQGESSSQPDDAAGEVEAPGAVVAGKYKLLEPLGEGGFGVVYLAEQTAPLRRKVAVKILKAGMDGRQVVARFEAERQALAIMDHPNIARVFDGGVTSTGRPFFVMELVKGVPITEFCDQHRLTPRQRLELFVDVCKAVQHAHQKGIIHRDLKPSNVLVSRHDTTPVVKVIDFGVAKALGQELTDKTLFTSVAQMIGTPLYMSPEQAGMSDLDVDTRSDIYSLGVLLYELLTGTTPFSKERFKKAAYDEIRRIIREEDPPKPSTRVSESTETLPSVAANRGVEPRRLGGLMRGELDWIVMKSLEKDRNRRYETANGFAADVLRYLSGEAVLAVPPSTAYRLRKFLRRHKGMTVAASLVLFSLATGAVGASWGMIQANAAAKRESLEKKRAELAEEETLEAFRASTDDAVEQLIGSKPELGPQERAYLERTLKRWQASADRQGDDERSRATRAEGRSRVAHLWHKLGKVAEARAEYDRALELQASIAQRRPDAPRYQQSLAMTHVNLGSLQADQGEHGAARANYAKARALLQDLVANHPSEPEFRRDLAATHNNLAVFLSAVGERDAARKEYEASLDLRRRLADEFPGDPEYRQNLAATYNNLGRLLAELGETNAARKEFEAARDLRKTLLAQQPSHRDIQKGLATVHQNLGALLAELRENDAAEKEYEAALVLLKTLATKFPAVLAYQEDLAQTQNNYAYLLSGLGKHAAARAAFAAALSLQKTLAAADPTLLKHQHHLAATHNNLGLLLAGLGERDDARKEFEAARDIHQRLAATHPNVPAFQINLGGSYCNFGDFIREEGRFDESLTWFEKAIAALEPIHRASPRAAVAGQFLRNSHANRARALDALKRHADALKDWDRVIELSTPAEHPRYRVERATSKLNAGRFADAVAEVEELTTPAAKFTAGTLYDFACVYSVASGKIAEKKQAYADRAMELLRRSARAGFKDADVLKKDPDLEPIRHRDDFKKFVQELEALQKPK